MAASFRFEPCPSCCETCTETRKCFGGMANDSPETFTLHVAGASDLNGDYVVTWSATVFNGCQWLYSLPSAVCGVDNILFQNNTADNSLNVFFRSGTTVVFWFWRLNNSGTPMTWDHLPISNGPYIPGTPTCDVTGSSVSVSSC